MMRNPKIGLALGSGASRGLAHIGVLQVLEEAGIRPHYIAASSIGSVIAALFACGITPQMIEGIARNLDAKSCYDVAVPRIGFIQGKRIEDMMRILTRDRDFADLEIPLAITATDLIGCRRVVIKEGKVYKAVRASISIPGIFHPIHEDGLVLVDGGILERVPVNVVREMGADIVIGVDVGFRGNHDTPGNIFEVILQSLEVMELEVIKHTISQDDILICPEVSRINPLQFDKLDESITAGKEATLLVLDRIKEAIRLF